MVRSFHHKDTKPYFGTLRLKALRMLQGK